MCGGPNIEKLMCSRLPLSRTSMKPVKKFEIVNVWDSEKKSKILVSYRFENWVKVVSSSRALEENRTLYWFDKFKNFYFILKVKMQHCFLVFGTCCSVEIRKDKHSIKVSKFILSTLKWVKWKRSK